MLFSCRLSLDCINLALEEYPRLSFAGQKSDSGSAKMLSFCRLPLELRLQIWREALPGLIGSTLHLYKKGRLSIEEKLAIFSFAGCVPVSTDLVTAAELRLKSLDEDVSFDLPLLSVCTESREVALRWIKQEGVHLSSFKGCCIGQRPFCTNRDALYITDATEPAFETEAFDYVGRNLWLRGIKDHDIR